MLYTGQFAHLPRGENHPASDQHADNFRGLASRVAFGLRGRGNCLIVVQGLARVVLSCARLLTSPKNSYLAVSCQRHLGVARNYYVWV